jgi:hypothetical protein
MVAHTGAGSGPRREVMATAGKMLQHAGSVNNSRVSKLGMMTASKHDRASSMALIGGREIETRPQRR